MGERNDSIKLFGVVISSDNHNEGSGSRMKRNRWTEEEEEDRGILIDESEKSRDHSNNKMGERNHSTKLFGVVISSDHHNEDSGSRKKRSRWTEEEEENRGILVDEREKSGDDSYNKGKWSEEEHNSFLIGLDKVGKGNWNRIAKQFVPSRSSAQVASHAQNFFGRYNKNRAALHGASSQSSISVSLDNLALTL
ncbi:hypothetical protein RDI58_012944 [Solanum bulbocastanum]|uniref:Uncharacterized protein n=1 Tax=Solanum bulbocastanum TaxID=147425 RepID=A0AAN8YDM1_SOLBU